MPPAGLPRDPAQWLALLLAVLALVAARPLTRPTARPALFVSLAAAAAAALSAVYVAVYLRGGPRIIDATSYFLEARALAAGHFAWPLDAPDTATLGRFLLRTDSPDGPRVAVIFPPGYPAVLAAGFLAGAPLLVGPLLAAGIAVATYDLAARVARILPQPAHAPPISVPQIAALFSVTCAALRYHTADTMSHGLAALCVAAALALFFHAADGGPGSTRFAALAGLAAGWLVATRPASGVALAFALASALFLTVPASRAAKIRLRLLTALAVGAIPGIALLLAHQRAATGAFGLSSQQLYYALADGPPGCFRYGFGARIGCVAEHGDFVRTHLADGFGAREAAGTTMRRLYLHLIDATNAVPLAGLIPLGAAASWKAPRVRVLALAVVAQIAVYVPFYFDGNYPGGGARFFADVLPVEHVLAAIAVAHLAARSRRPATAAASALAVGLVGFAFHAGFGHALLRDRDGGRPMFEPAVLQANHVDRGLVFFDTDHGFHLALDPDAAHRSPIQAARYHGDDLDRLAWEAHGRPPAFRYRFPIGSEGPSAPSVEPLAFLPVEAATSLAIEGESLWPLLDQRGGWASRDHAGIPCASAGRWLGLHTSPENASVTVRAGLPARWAAGRAVSPRIALDAGTRGEVALFVDGLLAHAWPLVGEMPTREAHPSCLDLAAAPVDPAAHRVELVLRREEGTLALDRVRLSSAEND